MKNLFKTKLVLLFVVSAPLVARTPSEIPPISNPPQFIVIGSDDNSEPDGVHWIVDYLASKNHKNGSKLRMSFFSNTQVNNDENEIDWSDKNNPKIQALISAHRKAYLSGHEVSAHTNSHPWFVKGVKGDDQIRKSKAFVKKEIIQNIEHLQKAGIPKAHMWGFRTPYLAYSDSVLAVVKELGFKYDCSFNEGIWKEGEYNFDIPGRYTWPYTFDSDNVSPGNNASYWNQTHDISIGTHTELWELACYMLCADPSDQVHFDNLDKEYGTDWRAARGVTGLDYNWWYKNDSKLNKEQTLRLLKHSLLTLKNGNRTPMTIGIHTQYYLDNYKGGNDFPNISCAQERKEVMEEFIDWACQQEGVYFVSGAQLIKWLEDENRPNADNFNPDEYLPWIVEN